MQGMPQLAAVAMSTSLFRSPYLPHHLEHGVGGRFLAHVLTLADGHIHQSAEEMLAERLRGRIKLVAHHGHGLASGLQFPEQRHDAVVGLRGVEAVLQIVLAEDAERRLEERVVVAIGHGPLDEFPHAVAHKPAHVVGAVLGQLHGAHGMVATGGQVGQGVEQRTVEVEDIYVVVVVVVHRLLRVIIVLSLWLYFEASMSCSIVVVMRYFHWLYTS